MKKVASVFAALTSLLFSASSASAQVLLITQPRVLTSLEDMHGLSMVNYLIAPDQNFHDLTAANDILSKETAFSTIVQSIDDEIVSFKKADPSSGTGKNPHTGSLYDHRLFDVSTLTSPLTRFILVGVVNRMDRMYISPDTCGEVRLIYRLAYRVASKTDPSKTGVASRLPMTINMVFNARDPETESTLTCDQIAKKWDAITLDPRFDGPADQVGINLVHSTEMELIDPSTGPLAPSLINSSKLKQVEINFQAVRWPSATRPDLGGQSEYVLKIFNWNAATHTLSEKLLENQPDIAKIAANPSLKGQLLQWVNSHLQEINDGTAILPDQFLATTATDIAPQGIKRLVNHPFQQIFSPRDFAGDAGKLGSFPMIQTPSALIRRLDDHSCTTCHQSRNMAGFHLMGKDPENLYPGNSVFVGGSPHLFSDQLRRGAIVQAIDDQKTPSFARGYADRPNDIQTIQTLEGSGLYNGWGAHCSLGKDPTFASWNCADGLVCQADMDNTVDPAIGACMSKVGHEVGDACDRGTLTSFANANKDRFVQTSTFVVASQGETCSQQKGGFPGGMLNPSREKCEANQPIAGVDHASCGLLPTGIPGFNDCVGEGKDYTTCLNTYKVNRVLRFCDAKNPCRDDYICAESVSENQGSCVPPYFIFQFRVDGHPVGSYAD